MQQAYNHSMMLYYSNVEEIVNQITQQGSPPVFPPRPAQCRPILRQNLIHPAGQANVLRSIHARIVPPCKKLMTKVNIKKMGIQM